MKKLVLLLSVVLLIAETCFGQNHLQPIRSYLSKKGEPKIFYSPRSMKNYIYENEKYRETLFDQTGENDVESMCQKFRVAKDTTLLAGTYLNSGENPITGEYESFPGKYYRGDVTVYENYENGYYKKILVYKDECGNVLNLGYDNFQQYGHGQAAKKEQSYTNLSSDLQAELRKPVQSQQEDWSYTAPKKVPAQTINLNLPPVEEPSLVKKQLHLGWFIIPPAIIGTGILTYFIVKNNLRSSPNTGHGNDPPLPPDPGGAGNDPPPPKK